MRQRLCRKCARLFEPTSNSNWLCNKCGRAVDYNRRKHRRVDVDLKCVVCGNRITKPRSFRYCSKRCRVIGKFRILEQYKKDADKNAVRVLNRRSLLERIKSNTGGKE